MWNNFLIFAIISLILWIIGAIASYKDSNRWLIYGTTSAGIAIFMTYIILMWITLG